VIHIATVTDIASALGLSDRAIRKRAKQWQPTGERVQGGGNSYDLETLPLEAKEKRKVKAYLKAKQFNEIALDTTLPAVREAAPVPALIVEKKLPALTELTKRQVAIMEARVWFMRTIEARPKGYSIKKAMKSIVKGVADGEQTYTAMAAAANDRKGQSRKLSESSLMRWWSTWTASGNKSAALAPSGSDAHRVSREAVLVHWVRDYQPGSRLPMPQSVPAWLPYFLDEYRRPEKPEVADSHRKMLLPSSIPRPSYWQVSRLLEKLPVTYLEKYRKTGAEYRSLLGFGRRDFSMEDPFAVGQIDGHSLKAYVAHPTTGAHFHPEICAIICMKTKVLAGYSSGVAESWRTVSDAFRHACTTYDGKVGSVFSRIEADRGAGNMAVKNSDKLIGIFARLGCELVVPERGGNPQGHGGIERSNKSIWIRAAKDLITYTGKDMDRGVRKKVYTRLEKDLKKVEKAGMLGQVEKTSDLLMSWREFLQWMDKVAWEYNNTPHSALPKITCPQTGKRRHMTPFESLADHIARGWEPLAPEDDVLPHLFMPHEEINVFRCEFTLHGNKYHAHELVNHHKRKLIAAYDIHDAHKVWVMDQDERLICQATWNGNKITGRPESERERNEREREERRVKNKQKQIGLMQAETDRSIIVEQPEIEAKRLTSIPTPIELQEQSQTPRKIVQMHQSVPDGFRVPHDREDRWYLWNEIHQRVLAEDNTLSDEEIRFYTSFRTSATWKVFDKIRATAL